MWTQSIGLQLVVQDIGTPPARMTILPRLERRQMAWEETYSCLGIVWPCDDTTRVQHLFGIGDLRMGMVLGITLSLARRIGIVGPTKLTHTSLIMQQAQGSENSSTYTRFFPCWVDLTRQNTNRPRWFWHQYSAMRYDPGTVSK